jgi:hypothetical protein
VVVVVEEEAVAVVADLLHYTRRNHFVVSSINLHL